MATGEGVKTRHLSRLGSRPTPWRPYLSSKAFRSKDNFQPFATRFGTRHGGRTGGQSPVRHLDAPIAAV